MSKTRQKAENPTSRMTKAELLAKVQGLEETNFGLTTQLETAKQHIEGAEETIRERQDLITRLDRSLDEERLAKDDTRKVAEVLAVMNAGAKSPDEFIEFFNATAGLVGLDRDAIRDPERIDSITKITHAVIQFGYKKAIGIMADPDFSGGRPGNGRSAKDLQARLAEIFQGLRDRGGMDKEGPCDNPRCFLHHPETAFGFRDTPSEV